LGAHFSLFKTLKMSIGATIFSIVVVLLGILVVNAEYWLGKQEHENNEEFND
jgi:hypothetical protein